MTDEHLDLSDNEPMLGKHRHEHEYNSVYQISNGKFYNGDHVKRKSCLIDSRNRYFERVANRRNDSLYRLALSKSMISSSPTRARKKCVLRQKSVPCHIGSSSRMSQRQSQQQQRWITAKNVSIHSQGKVIGSFEESDQGFSDSLWSRSSERRRIDLTRKIPRGKHRTESTPWTNYFIYPIVVIAMILIGALLYLFNNTT